MHAYETDTAEIGVAVEDTLLQPKEGRGRRRLRFFLDRFDKKHTCHCLCSQRVVEAPPSK